MGVVKRQGYVVRLVSNWFTSFLLHINEAKIPEIQLFWNITLRNPRPRSWMRSNFKTHISPRIQLKHFPLFHVNRTSHFWGMGILHHILKVSKITSPKSGGGRGSNQVLYWLDGRLVRSLSCRQANFPWSMPQPWPWMKAMDSHLILFPRHISYLFYISTL